MKLFDEFKEKLLEQKSQIESLGRMKGGHLELNLGTFVVSKGDKCYSNGTFSFETPDEFDRREATELAFSTGGVALKSEVYWGRKYQSICQILSAL